MAPPLKSIKKDGTPYTRFPAIEAAIDVALTQSLDILRCRARISEPAHPEYMPTECLLHLVRAARLASDVARVNHLLPFLLSRCEDRLRATIPDHSRADAAGLRDDILQDFGLRIAKAGTDQDTHVLDFFEIRFNAALTRLRLNHLEKDNTRRAVFNEIPETFDEDGTPIDDDHVLARLSEAARAPARQENYVYLTQVLKFIATLPPHEREAVINCCIRGLKIESEDPAEVTAATLAGVTPRAISKRLKNAAAKLKKFNEESNP